MTSPLGFKATVGSALFELCGGVCDICSLRFTSGATPLPVYIASIASDNPDSFFIVKITVKSPGRCGQVVSASACQAGGRWFKSGILPLLKHACGESDWLRGLSKVFCGGGEAFKHSKL